MKKFNNLYCIIINKSSDPEEIHNMLKSLESFNFEKIYYVADRCSVDFNIYLHEYNSNDKLVKIYNSAGDGRKTSSLRNKPVKEIISNNEDASIVFIDGDRFVVSYNNFDVKKNWVFNVEENTKTKIDDDEKYECDNKFYSAGIHLNNKTIKKLLETDGFIFDESLESVWGIEDLDLGNRIIKLRDKYNDPDYDYQYADGIKLKGNYNYGYKNQFEEAANVAKLICLEISRDSFF